MPVSVHSDWCFRGRFLCRGVKFTPLFVPFRSYHALYEPLMKRIAPYTGLSFDAALVKLHNSRWTAPLPARKPLKEALAGPSPQSTHADEALRPTSAVRMTSVALFPPHPFPSPPSPLPACVHCPQVGAFPWPEGHFSSRHEDITFEVSSEVHGSRVVGHVGAESSSYAALLKAAADPTGDGTKVCSVQGFAPPMPPHAVAMSTLTPQAWSLPHYAVRAFLRCIRCVAFTL